jgi:hypothetical protein
VHSTGALTTLWVTAVVIASNVVVFNLVSNTHTTKGGNDTATNRRLEGAAAGPLDGCADRALGDGDGRCDKRCHFQSGEQHTHY